MSDVNPLVVVVVAALVLLIAYAAFQFRRQCQEDHRRNQQDAATGRTGKNNSDKTGMDPYAGRLR
jgi:membrane protein implicated in regulation of membrane protease activity